MAEFSRPKRAKKKRNAQSAGGGDKQKINEFRDKNNITIQLIMPGSGLSKYSPVFSFEELNHPPYGFRETTMEVIKSLDYQSPMPVQSEVFPLFLQGHHMLVSAPTGSGKTAAYLLPVLHAISTEEEATVTATDGTSRKHVVAPRCVVLSTTQELAGQVWMEAVRLGRNLFPQHGKIVILKRKHYNLCKKEKSLTGKPSRNIRDQRLPRDTKLLITTPKRLATLITRTGAKCPIDFTSLRWLIIDECDKLLEANLGGGGDDKALRSFRSQLSTILTGIRVGQTTRASSTSSSTSTSRLCTPVVALFSATLPRLVVDWATEELSKECFETKGLVQLTVGASNAAVSSIKQELRYCGTEQGKLLEMRKLLLSGLSYPCLIFTESRQRAGELFQEILLSGDKHVLASVLSAEKTEAQREATVRAFREGKINALICTDLLGRGMDFKGLTMVVNYDLPPSATEYIHRVGRTGRAGLPGHAITLWTDADLPHLSAVLEVMKRSGAPVDEELQRLVSVWCSRRAAQTRTRVTGGVLSQRRGERRLAARVVRGSGKQRIKQKQLLRPWNPPRAKISEVPGALARNIKMASQTRNSK
ncbi:DEAD (Asp-Glu-Ala-Asp) box polypeptide 52 [Sparganum proliferum]